MTEWPNWPRASLSDAETSASPPVLAKGCASDVTINTETGGNTSAAGAGAGAEAGTGAAAALRAGARRGAAARFLGAGGAGVGSDARSARGVVSSGRFLLGDRFLAGLVGFSSDIQP